MTNARGGNAVVAFARRADGHLRRVGSFPTGGTGSGSFEDTAHGLVLGTSQGEASPNNLIEDAELLFATNARSDSIAVFRVAPGGSEAARFELTYPDGPRDAETLLAHPRTGRLFVVSKTVFGGTVYAAPRRIEPVVPNPMRAVAVVPGLLTDGAFLPDGRNVLLRGYADASLLSFPDFAVLGSFELPEQEQGEGVAIGDDGRILLSSEGRGAEVLEVKLPQRLQMVVDRRETEATPRSLTPTPSASADWTGSKRADEPTRQASDVQTRRVGGWVLLGTIGALVATGVVSAARSRRRPGE